MRIILPKTLHKIDPNYGPLFFLAGPMRGGNDWQAKCCEEIQKYIPYFYVASPRRFQKQEDHRLLKFRVAGDEEFFKQQLPWERHYLDIAGVRGCIIFWLPCEEKSDHRFGGDHPYAMDTRGELGEWRGRLMYDPSLRVVIGAEEGFPGLSQIQRNFDYATKSDFPIYLTLEETVIAAVNKVR